MPTFHTARSPSQAKRFRTCVGSLALCNALPAHQRNVASESAMVGTCAHALIERCLREKVDPESYKGRLIEIIGDDEGVSILRKGAKVPGSGRKVFEVDDSMLHGVSVMIDYVRRRMQDLMLDDDALHLESRTNPLPERDDTSGTADVTLDAWPELLEVVDYKNGIITVEHEDNDQLAAYLLGKALESDFSHENYCITIVQPNVAHEEGPVRPYFMTKAQLLAFQKAYRADIERNEKAEADPRAPQTVDDINPEWAKKFLDAGDDADHCTFCDAAPICPARLALSHADAKADFADEPVNLDAPDNAAAAERILAWAPRMQRLIGQAQAYLFRALEAGHKSDDWMIGYGRSVRVLVDKDETRLVKSILRDGYIDDPKLMYSKPALLTGPQLEKLVPRKQREDFAKKYLVKPRGKPVLMPRDSGKKEIAVGPEADFADADEFEFG